MSRNPLTEGWRYYGCARWGCDAVNPDYQSYAAAGRSWCLHHRPGPVRRFLMAWTIFPTPGGHKGEAMLPVAVVKRSVASLRELEAERLREALKEITEWAEAARGHYGIEECSGPGRPRTEWDEIQDGLRAAALFAREALSGPAPNEDRG